MNYTVRTSDLMQASDEMKRISDKTYNIADKVKSAISQTRSSISLEIDQIGGSAIISSDISDSALGMEQLSCMLEKVCEIYDNYEERIQFEKFSQNEGYESDITSIAQNDGNESQEKVREEKNIYEIISDLFTIADKGWDDLVDLLKLDDRKTVYVYTSSILDFAGDVFGYFDSLHKMFKGDMATTSDALATWIDLFKESLDLETGIYKLLVNVLNPYNASKLYDKYNGGMTWLKIISSMVAFSKEGLESYNVFTDAESTGYEKGSQLLDLWNAGIKAIGKTYIATDCSSKVLQFISKSGTNQILDSSILMFKSIKEVSKKAKVVGTKIKIADVVFSSFSAGIKKYGECKEDGSVTWADAGDIGVAFACSGLSAVGRGLTGGVVDIDGEATANYITMKGEEFMRGDSWAANYIRNKENSLASRYIVSVGSGAYILGKETWEGMKIGAKLISGWASSLWNK